MIDVNTPSQTKKSSTRSLHVSITRVEGSMKREDQSGSSLPYWVWKRRKTNIVEPNKTTNRPLALLLYLHGASGRGSDWEHLSSGLPKMLIDNSDNESIMAGFDVVVVAPQCPCKTEWAKPAVCAALIRLLDHCQSGNDVAVGQTDRNKVYCTGMSMGGLGCWNLAAREPARFAAILPICGGGNVVFAPLLKDLPIMFAHAEDDKVVPISETCALVDALRSFGNKRVIFKRWQSGAMLGVENDAWCEGHNVWDECYFDRTGEVWLWLLAQRR